MDTHFLYQTMSQINSNLGASFCLVLKKKPSPCSTQWKNDSSLSFLKNYCVIHNTWYKIPHSFPGVTAFQWWMGDLCFCHHRFRVLLSPFLSFNPSSLFWLHPSSPSLAFLPPTFSAVNWCPVSRPPSSAWTKQWHQHLLNSSQMRSRFPSWFQSSVSDWESSLGQGSEASRQAAGVPRVHTDTVTAHLPRRGTVCLSVWPPCLPPEVGPWCQSLCDVFAGGCKPIAFS